MNYTINIKNTSHKMYYETTIGPYTRKHDAIRGLARIGLPNIKNASIAIYESMSGRLMAAEVVTKMTSKTITTVRFNHITRKEEGGSTYKFDY